MISYTGINSEEADRALTELCSGGGICACRTLCLMESYGGYSGLIELWLQYDDSGNVCSSVIKYAGDMTVVLSVRSDKAELRDFLQAAGAGSAVSEDEIFPDSGYGIIMRRKKSNFCSDDAAVSDLSADPKDAYSVMESCRGRGFDVPAYEDFLLDLSHRLRHGTARCCLIYENGDPAAFAMTSALSSTQAVIGSVCTAPQYRRQGFGSRCVDLLCSVLGGREIFIVRSPGENEEFYRSLGFEQCRRRLYIYK